jgi:sucrose phosphorylase
MASKKVRKSAADPAEELRLRVGNHLKLIYPDEDIGALITRLLDTMGLPGQMRKPRWFKNNWSEKDVAVITYANSILKEGEPPLRTLNRFLYKNLQKELSWVHILPFFPFSSDDGFAVIDYVRVNESFGNWDHIYAISGQFKVMADLVINHCSGMSHWFEQFRQNKPPGNGYFLEVDPDTDTSLVVRPRTSPLLREVQTLDGIKHVWCTFSHDQPDLDFRNPDVLAEMVGIIRFYLDRGVRILRLDAVAFLWKEQGTNCLNLPQTHEVVRLIRTLMEYYKPGSVLITETNIPNRENLSYFGNSNEAHLIYNFSFPPLMLHALVTGNCHALKSWMMSMPPARNGTTFFNFMASHDGIGLRPLEGLVPEEELQHLLAHMEGNGGRVSWRSLGDGTTRPYEINISLFDAFRGTLDKPEDPWQEARFICAHVVMLSIEGLPAFYIHSLFATTNDYEKFANTNNNRAINRHNWDIGRLESALSGDTHHHRIYTQLRKLIGIRKKQKAFHPNATMFTLHIGDEVFAYWRQTADREQSIFCLNNITDQEQEVSLSSLNLIITDTWYDLLSGTEILEGQSSLQLAPYQSVWLTNICY